MFFISWFCYEQINFLLLCTESIPTARIRSLVLLESISLIIIIEMLYLIQLNMVPLVIHDVDSETVEPQHRD